MSRKVLYRAWDKKYKVMLEGFAIYSEGNEIGMSQSDVEEYYSEEQIEQDMGGHFGSGDDWLFILNDFELLEDTGLIDKNSNPIYEGDVIQWKSKPDWHSGVDEIYIVKFGDIHIWSNQSYANSVGFYMTRKENDIQYGIRSLIHPGIETEIIGNIYEYPEHLKS